MKNDLIHAVKDAVQYLEREGIEIPPDIQVKARRFGIWKRVEELSITTARYHDAITKALIAYFEGGNSLASRNAFRSAAVDALSNAFDTGYSDGGGEFPMEDEPREWLIARVELEMGYIATLYEEAKGLRKEEDFDYFSWITFHADAYSRTLRELYNVGSLYARKDIMVTFVGDDGKESCDTCQMLKGKRKRVSWFVRNNYVPPHGIGLECHPGRRCQHYLEDDQGNQVTI